MFIYQNEYGTDQFFQVLDEHRLGYIVKLAEENLKMPVWKCNGKCYPQVNDKQVTDYAVGKCKTDGDIEVINFTKYMPHILDLTFYVYMNLKSLKELLKDIQFPKINKVCKMIIYRTGLSESSSTHITKPFSLLSHCRVSCGSPCCTKLCGEDNHCFEYRYTRTC